ncbi:hypothetical protein EGW08_001993, partial [Elysia chlorotica]
FSFYLIIDSKPQNCSYFLKFNRLLLIFDDIFGNSRFIYQKLDLDLDLYYCGHFSRDFRFPYILPASDSEKKMRMALSPKEKLDEKVLQIFDALEELYKTQERLEQVMKDGFFNMSRARYSMGLKRVSADQILEAEMRANKTVLICEDGSPVSIEENFIASLDKINATETSPMFTLHQATDSAEATPVPEITPKPKDDVKESETGLRKRNLGEDLSKLSLKDNDHDESKSDKEKNETSSSKSGKNVVGDHGDGGGKSEEAKAKNPLNLFGILVSRELRTSQNRFEEAVSLAVQISNLKQQLRSLQSQYKTLRNAATQSTCT